MNTLDLASLRSSVPFVIGRAANVELRVMDLSVGMRVVRLERRAEGVWIDDLDSGGGSSLEIDGEVTPRPHAWLRGGAILRAGGVAFRVVL